MGIQKNRLDETVILSSPYVMGIQKNRLDETVILSSPNICKKVMGNKIFTILHSKFMLI